MLLILSNRPFYGILLFLFIFSLQIIGSLLDFIIWKDLHPITYAELMFIFLKENRIGLRKGHIFERMDEIGLLFFRRIKANEIVFVVYTWTRIVTCLVYVR